MLARRMKKKERRGGVLLECTGGSSHPFGGICRSVFGQVERGWTTLVGTARSWDEDEMCAAKSRGDGEDPLPRGAHMSGARLGSASPTRLPVLYRGSAEFRLCMNCPAGLHEENMSGQSKRLESRL